MSRIVEYSGSDAITREACAWIAQLDGDQPPSAEDLAALRAWMNRSPAHRAELKRLAEVWGQLNVLTELAGATQRSAQVNQRAGIRFLKWIPKAAAAVLVLGVLIATVGVLTIRSGSTDGSRTIAYRTDVGEQLRQSLSDGSKLTLNTDSSVRLAFSPAGRIVWLLHGEAHFEVAHDLDRPFIVYAGNSQVRAVGTAFSVRVQEREVEVIVNEGAVELATATASGAGPAQGLEQISAQAQVKPLAVLEAGAAASFNDRIESIVTVPEDELARRLSWTEGMLVFSGDRLDSVVSEVSRYTTQRIEFADPAVRELRIGGRFQVGELDALFEALEMSFGVQVRREGDRIVLSSLSDGRAD